MGVIWDILANTNTNCKDTYSIYEQMDSIMGIESISEDEKQKIVAKFWLLHPLKWKKAKSPSSILLFVWCLWENQAKIGKLEKQSVVAFFEWDKLDFPVCAYKVLAFGGLPH